MNTLMWWMSDSCRWRNWGSEKFTDLSEVAWLITGRVKMLLPVLPLTPACFTLHLSASSSGVISWGGFPAWLRRSLCFYAKCRSLSHKIWERNKEETWNTLNPGNEAYLSSPGALHTACELWEHNLLCLCLAPARLYCMKCAANGVHTETLPLGVVKMWGDQWTPFSSHWKAKAALHRSRGGGDYWDQCMVGELHEYKWMCAFTSVAVTQPPRYVLITSNSVGITHLHVNLQGDTYDLFKQKISSISLGFLANKHWEEAIYFSIFSFLASTSTLHPAVWVVWSLGLGAPSRSWCPSFDPAPAADSEQLRDTVSAISQAVSPLHRPVSRE